MNDRELLEPAAWLLCEMIYCLDEEPFVQRTVCLTKFNEDCEPLYLHPPQQAEPKNFVKLRAQLEQEWVEVRAIRDAYKSVTQKVVEPVAFRKANQDGFYRYYEPDETQPALCESLYLHPQKAEQVPLTNEQINEIASRLEQQGNTLRQFARAIEAHHGIGGEA